jgi:hypothetical protein
MTKPVRQPPSRLESQVLEILRTVGVPIQEIDACVYWAFGDDAWYVPIMPTWMERWNHLHKETGMQVKKNDSFVEFVAAVAWWYLWKGKQDPKNN